MVKSFRTRGSGFMQRTMDWMRMRGVKYWPAPFLPSLAAFQQALIGFGLDVHVQAGPVGLVDQADEPLEVDGLLNRFWLLA